MLNALFQALGFAFTLSLARALGGFARPLLRRLGAGGGSRFAPHFALRSRSLRGVGQQRHDICRDQVSWGCVFMLRQNCKGSVPGREGNHPLLKLAR
jgi:hypothetical protein